MYRAFVPLVNNDAFQQAFQVQPGDKMYLPPEDRVKIW
jgi:putative endopeptidase